MIRDEAEDDYEGFIVKIEERNRGRNQEKRMCFE